MSVVDSGDEEARALGGILKIADVEEEEALLGGVRLNGAGGEGCVLEFVAIVLGESAVGFVAARQGKRNLIGGAGARGADGGESAAKIVERVGRSLGAVAGDELKAGMAEDDGLIAFVGEDNEDGKDGVLQHFGVEERGFVGSVIGVGTEGQLLARVGVVGSHRGCRNEAGHDEVAGVGGEDERGKDGGEEGKPLCSSRRNLFLNSLHNSYHGGNYRRERGVIAAERDATSENQEMICGECAEAEEVFSCVVLYNGWRVLSL